MAGNEKQEINIISRRAKWLIQLGYWSFQFMIQIGLYAIIEEESTAEVILWSLLTGGSTLAIFYAYFYKVVPSFLGKNNLKFTLITVAVIVIYPPLKYFIDQQLGLSSLSTLTLDLSQTPDESTQLIQELGRRLYTPLWNIPLAMFIRFMVDWFKNRRIKAMMETQQLKSELALLRNQVNPHFLFNVLNNIDTMVYPHSTEASDAIVKLSAIMRYMLYESDTDRVDISKEIEYLRSYVDLQKMRLKSTENISFQVNVSNPHEKIAPMILIPFVENAFKHANTTGEELKIAISLTEVENEITLVVCNSFDPHLQNEKDQTGGIGLSNVRKRLQLIYPNSHSLNITEANMEYQTTLTIKSESL